MLTLREPRMSNKGGRPFATEGERGTRQIRVFEDMADMIGWITRINGGSAAQLVDPLIRESIESAFKMIEADVERIKRAEAEVRKAEEAAKNRKTPKKG